MKKFKVYPYKLGSASAKQIAQTLGVKRVRPDGTYRYFNSHIIINWGSSSLPNWDITGRAFYLNHPSAVAKAANKTHTLKALKEACVPIPIFFTNKEVLIRYTESLGRFPTVYCRTILNGHSGQGIVLANDVSEIVSAPLYTLRFKATKEWRLHVFKDRVFDFAKKSRRENAEDRASGLIRNYDGGWIFKRGDVQPSNTLKTTTIKAVQALGLDFGAVDIAEDQEGNVCVYEVNTSPGIGGETTLNTYTTVFSEYLRAL